MITIKNASQIAKMREAGALLHEVLEQLKGKIEPGITTKELDRYAEKLIRGYGAVPSFLNYEGYPASICASVDSQVVLGQRHLVGVFEIAADGQAVRDARDQNPHRLEQAGDIARRRFALDIRIGGQNDLVDILLADAGQQLPQRTNTAMIPASAAAMTTMPAAQTRTSGAPNPSPSRIV